jgi:pimeloyl-ACP methyl ester carboxylesterase
MKISFTALFVSGIVFMLMSGSNPVKDYPSPLSENVSVMKMQSNIIGKGTPIVLVPGGLTGWASWEPHSRILAERHTVIRVQLLSVQYGLENRSLPADYSVRTESEALAATLDSLGYTQPIDIVGWSFGAFTALQYSLDHPEHVRSLTLIEPPAMWVLRSDGMFDEATQKEADFFLTLQGDITENMLAEFLQHAGFLKPGVSARELPQWNVWVPFRQSLRNSPTVVKYNDDIKRLQDFQAPALLVKGTGSAFWLHNIIDRLAENIPNSRIVEFPGGHAPHIVSMDQFILELEKFQRLSKH